jgi:centromere/kinetochore protein ZW10
MSAAQITPAILQYIDHNAYPDSEAISSAELDSSALEQLSTELRKSQDEVKAEIATLSKASAPDIDTWISRAKELQKDILRSRATAREVVEEAEKGRELREGLEERSKKVQFLEKEVEFNASLRQRLESVRDVKLLVGEGKEAVVAGKLQDGLSKWQEADGKLALLGSGDEGVGALLTGRVVGLRSALQEAVQSGWDAYIHVDSEARKVSVAKEFDINGLIATSQGLGEYESVVKKLAREFERAVVRPRMAIARDGKVDRIAVHGGTIQIHQANEDAESHALFEDLKAIIDWLSSTLPSDVANPLWERLSLSLVTKLEETWLDAAVPLDISDMPAFQEVLTDVLAFADRVDSFQGTGSKPLRDWVQSAPRTWLTKRRETVLGDVRNLVFTGLRETKVVERVETQMVSKDDALADGDDDEWDTAWDEPEEQTPVTPRREQAVEPEDDDEASAWGADFDDDDAAPKEDGNEEDDAWGWGDGDESAAPNPISPKKSPSKPNGDHRSKPAEREMTLREKFTVTAVPDSILALLQQIIADAQNLAGPEYASSPIAPAATGLYTLPTLALAIYRATASTAYSKLPCGNMLIYNDASRLADQLKSWQADQPPASRLRLSTDVTALEMFAKRAYSTEMESQRTILKDLLEGAQGFSNCAQAPFKQECESAVEQTVDRLREVHKQWDGILSSSALLQSTGSLLGTFTGKMIVEIQDLPDIGEADSKELKSLCDKATTARELFVQEAPGGEKRDMTFVYCPNWLKFQYLAEIMESSLADIKYLWKEGELSLEFEAEEVVGLVEALFAESQLRRGAIGDG